LLPTLHTQVFLALAFGHLIPECTQHFGHGEVTPFLYVLGGYLLIFFVEKVAFDAHDLMHNLENSNLKNTDKNDATADAGKTGNDIAQSNGNMHSHAGGRSAVILLGALAVHSILEMMALGLADTFGDSALLTLSIALHQPAESIALLVAFLKSGMPQEQIIRHLSVFSCMGPIGIALGLAVNEYAAPIVDAIMLAIVAGTFVYVGATEVIPEEWENSENKWKKFGALMAGIASILMITRYTATLA
jgi:zinc transporter 1/2/3